MVVFVNMQQKHLNVFKFTAYQLGCRTQIH